MSTALFIILNAISVVFLGLAIFLHVRGASGSKGSSSGKSNGGDGKYFLLWWYLGILLYQLQNCAFEIFSLTIGTESLYVPGAFLIPLSVAANTTVVGFMAIEVAASAGICYILSLWHLLVQTLENPRFASFREFVNVKGRLKICLHIVWTLYLFANVILMILGNVQGKVSFYFKILQLACSVIVDLFLLCSIPVIVDISMIIFNSWRSKKRMQSTAGNSSNVIKPMLVLLLTICFTFLIALQFVYGQFNNNLLQLMKVIDLAFLLNRSVILPSFMANTIEISDGLCVFPHDRIWNGNGFASVFEMPAGNLTQTIRSQHNGLVPIHCVAKDSLKFGLSQARIITMWNEFFFTRIPLSHHREMMKHIHPSARITEAALAYMEHVGLMHDGIAEHFVGIHLRNFGSDCHEVMNLTYFTSPKEVFERINSTCSMSWSYLTNILKEYGLEANATKVYVSSDGQRPQIDAELNSHKNVYSLLKFRTEEGEATTRIIPPDIHEGIFEMVILSYSSLFLGQPYSSFSLNAQWWREARGFTNPSQVYFPSYSDTEAHGHPIYELEEVNKP